MLSGLRLLTFILGMLPLVLAHPASAEDSLSEKVTDFGLEAVVDVIDGDSCKSIPDRVGDVASSLSQEARIALLGAVIGGVAAGALHGNFDRATNYAKWGALFGGVYSLHLRKEAEEHPDVPDDPQKRWPYVLCQTVKKESLIRNPFVRDIRTKLSAQCQLTGIQDEDVVWQAIRLCVEKKPSLKANLQTEFHEIYELNHITCQSARLAFDDYERIQAAKAGRSEDSFIPSEKACPQESNAQLWKEFEDTDR